MCRDFFQVSLKELQEVVGELGMASTWTMECEASEYRETVAVLKSGGAEQPLQPTAHSRVRRSAPTPP